MDKMGSKQIIFHLPYQEYLMLENKGKEIGISDVSKYTQTTIRKNILAKDLYFEKYMKQGEINLKLDKENELLLSKVKDLKEEIYKLRRESNSLSNGSKSIDVSESTVKVEDLEIKTQIQNVLNQVSSGSENEIDEIDFSDSGKEQ